MLDDAIVNGIGNFVLGWMRQNNTAKWWKFLWAMFFSGFIGFLEGFGVSTGSCAAAWIAGKPMTPGWALVIGLSSGALWARICLTKEFRAAQNDLLKGMTVVLPQQEADDEFKPDYQTQTITKTEDLKKK